MEQIEELQNRRTRLLFPDVSLGCSWGSHSRVSLLYPAVFVSLNLADLQRRQNPKMVFGSSR